MLFDCCVLSVLVQTALNVKHDAHLPRQMIDEADRDGDGEVTEEDFFRIMKKTSLF